jgi:hypothetical protein
MDVKRGAWSVIGRVNRMMENRVALASYVLARLGPPRLSVSKLRTYLAPSYAVLYCYPRYADVLPYYLLTALPGGASFLPLYTATSRY